MSRATVVYLLMIVALVGGLWAVLAAGGRLVAPEDLGGRWTAVAPGGRWSAVSVEQSGEYFELTFGTDPAVPLTLVDQRPDGGLTLARGKWRVTVDPPAGPDGPRTFHVDGPAVGGATSDSFTGRLDGRPATAKAAAAG